MKIKDLILEKLVETQATIAFTRKHNLCGFSRNALNELYQERKELVELLLDEDF